MAFADEFARCMALPGLPIDEGSVPEGSALAVAIEYFKSQLDSLSPELKQGLNAVTGDGYAKMFSDPDGFGFIDAAYDAVLEAFDAASGMPIETAIQWCQHCIQQALAAAGEG
ncbi:MAG: hypothetical protein M3527_10035 [Actinomycetota bacterium]|nr:hypothetical protein [Acidimicrobiia bacterium]MDQ3294769.1 hypothetical protein [Actinomycetota bacterium]